MNETEFISLIEEVLEIEPGIIDFSKSLDDIDWDSLSNLTLISLLDSQFDTQVGAQQLQDATTLRELYVLINS